MKIAYFGCDLYMDCIRVLELHGFSISFVFIKPSTPYNEKLVSFAKLRKIPLIVEKPTTAHIELLELEGIECIFSCSYGWHIPIHQSIKYSVNVHPTMLPEGRGPNPLFWVLKCYQQHFGITFHKITNKYDCGDIIYQRKLCIEKNDSFETLMMKLEIQIPISLDKCLSNFEQFYQNSKIQTNGSHWPEVTARDILINWEICIEEIDLLVRSAGRFGVIAKLGEAYYMISRVEILKCDSLHNKGQVVKEDSEIIAVSALGGIVIIPKRSIISELNRDFLRKFL